MNSVSWRAARSFVVLAVAAWLVGVPAAALAQSGGSAPARPVSGLGYAFGGLGAASGEGESTATWHIGGGGEAIFADAIGVGAEIGYLNSFEEDSQGIGVFSVNGSYHFGSGKWRPFVTGGYTLGFRDGHANLFNLGGGVQYWLKPSVGLRIELRDHIWTEENDTAHFWGVRVGVTFR
jgi:Outer membrane protein beta-barrel domain